MKLDPAAGVTALSAHLTDPPAEGALRGLSLEASEQSAAQVLASVAWEGLLPDPDTLSAKDFLALL